MIYEDDIFYIPEKYLKMTTVELRLEREKLYNELKSNRIKQEKPPSSGSEKRKYSFFTII